MKKYIYLLVGMALAANVSAQSYKGSGGAFSLGVQSLPSGDLPRITPAPVDLSGVGFNFGGYLYWQFGKVTLGAKGYGIYGGEEEVDGLKHSLSGGAVLAELGYKLVYSEKHALYPFIGIGYGGMDYRVIDDQDVDLVTDPENPLFNTAEVRWDGLVYDVGLRWEYYLTYDEKEPSAGFLGLELGYQFSAPNNKWETGGGGTIRGVPNDFDMNGWFLKVTLGGFEGMFEK